MRKMMRSPVFFFFDQKTRHMDLHRLDRLPWDLQKMILAFRPGLPALGPLFVDELRVHMARRYCPVCGEYIDLPKKPTRPFPVHVHSRLWHGYKDVYRYTVFRPAVRLHMRPLPKKTRHAMPSFLYHHVYAKDMIGQDVRLMVLRRQPLYFFRMDPRKPRGFHQMVNAGLLSPFHNPEVILDDDFRAAFRVDEPENYTTITDTRRFYRNRTIAENVCAFFSRLLRAGVGAHHLVPLLARDDCPAGVLAAVLRADAVAVVRNVCRLKRCPKDLLLSVILYDPSLVEHVPEERLRRLFHHYPDVFMDLAPNPFFSLVDPLSATVVQRSLLV